MKHLFSTQLLAAATIALGALTAVSSAHARSDVTFSFGVQIPGVFVQSVPMVVHSQSFYAPAPNYYRNYDGGRHFDGGQHRAWQNWQRRGPYGDRDRDGIANIHDSGGPRNQWRQARLHGPNGDLDRDGIRNRRDRDRDGDGVRNRYDHRPNHPNRR